MARGDEITPRRHAFPKILAACLASALAAAIFFAWGFGGRAASQNTRGAIPVSPEILGGLEPGDLVFRTGASWISDAVLTADGGRYSHIGMLVRAGDGAWHVVHAVPEEVAGRGDAIVVDRLEFFMSRERSLGVAFCRMRAPSEKRERAAALAMQRVGEPFRIYARGKIPGENAARTPGGKGTYCTELVREVFLDSGVSPAFSFTQINLPGLSGEYLLPSAIRNSPDVELIYETK